MSAVRGTDGASLVVDGDPVSCRLVARGLAALTGTLAETADFLSRQADGADGAGAADAGPGCVWAAAYRARCRHLAAEATALRARTDTLASALNLLTEALERARAVLHDVEVMAAPHGLVVGHLLVSPAPGDREASAWVAWRDARVLVRLARRIERDARHAWQRALEDPVDHPAPAGPDAPVPPGPPLSPDTPCPAPQPRRPPRGPGPAPEDAPVPDLVPVVCGLTPRDPDGFCATPVGPLVSGRLEGARRAER